MRNIKLLVISLTLFLFIFVGQAQAEILRFESEDQSLVTKMYDSGIPFWNVYGTGPSSIIYASPHWSRMPLRYTLKAEPNTAYDVIFFSSDNDPGAGNLDISWDDGKTWDTSYRSVGVEKTVKKKVATDGTGIVSLIIANPDGLTSSLNYIKLRSMTQDALSENICLVNWVASNAEVNLNNFLKFLDKNPSCLQIRWREKGGEWQEAIKWQREDAVLTGKDSFFNVEVRINEHKAGIRFTVNLQVKDELNTPLEIAFCAPFGPEIWQRQFYPGTPYRILPPDAPANIRFLAEKNDWTTESPEHIRGDAYYYPFGVLEKEDIFLLWGSLDIGRFRVLSPNLIPNAIPCLVSRPLLLRKGESVSFDIFMKSFPKQDFLYRDVLRWYMTNWENSDPLTKDILVYKGRTARALPRGTHTYVGSFRVTNEDGSFNTTGKSFLKDLASLKIKSLWYILWHSWDEAYPTHEERVTGLHTKRTGEEIRRDIKALRDAGIYTYMYFRQFLTEEATRDDRAPYRDWMTHDEKGVPYRYGIGTIVPGSNGEKIHAAVVDFGNDAFRNWYVDTVKKCIDYYQPAGIAWDMGWLSSLWQYSKANPKTNYAHGIVRLQAEIYEWMKSKYPDMRVITNVAIGNPTTLFSDAILMESGLTGGMTELDYEAAKAIGTTIIGFEYPHSYHRLLQGLDIEKTPFMNMRYRAKGIDAIHISEMVPWPREREEAFAINLQEVQTDGEWHTIVVDLRTIPETKIKREGKTLTLGIKAIEDEGYLDIDYITFSAQSTTPSKKKPSLQEFPNFIDEDNISLWESRPAWVNNRADDFALTKDKEFLRFKVKEKEMKWEFIGSYGLLAQGYMKTLSLGACITGDLMDGFDTPGYQKILEQNACTWGENHNDILSFSAEAMAMPLVIDSNALRTGNDKILASAWANDKMIFLAAYNNGSEAISTFIKLSPTLTDMLKKPIIKVLDIYGQPKEGDEKQVKVNGKEILLTLDKGEGLLISSKP